MSLKSKQTIRAGKCSAIGAYPASETHNPFKFKLGSQPLGLWGQDWLLTLLLVIVTILAYQPAWNGTPIWDDDAHLTKPELRSLLQIPGAWLAVAIFALHPIQAESVAWISELKNMLSGLFYFGSVLAYLKFDRTRNLASYAVALVLFVFGLMSKTVIATLPAAILIIFWWKRGQLCGNGTFCHWSPSSCWGRLQDCHRSVL